MLRSALLHASSEMGHAPGRARSLGAPSRWLVALFIASVWPAVTAAQSCSSDCGDANANYCVAVNELIGCVNCSLNGFTDDCDVCDVCDVDRAGSVDIGELVLAVRLALLQPEPELRRFEGTCDRPCPAGGCLPPTANQLQPCGEGDVRVSRCDDSGACASTRIVPMAAGYFCFAMCSFVPPVLQYRDEATALRSINVGPVGASVGGMCTTAQYQSQLAAQGISEMPDIKISPLSEAVVRLVEERGFQRFDDAGVLEVSRAVEEANAESNFAGQDPLQAADLATTTARSDQGVQDAIERSIGTTIRVGHAAGQAGGRTTLAITLSTGGAEVAGMQNELHFPPQVRIATKANGKPDCSVNPDIGKPASTFSFLPLGCAPDEGCTAVRAFIVDLSNTDLIPNRSLLYSCVVAIAPGTSGPFAIGCEGALVSPPEGLDRDAACPPGEVIVTP